MEKDIGEIIVRETISLIGMPGEDHKKRHHYWRCMDCGNVTLSDQAILAPSPCFCGSIAFETVWNTTALK